MTMWPGRLGTLCCLLLAVTPALATQAPSLKDGIRLVEEGDFETALLTLDTVIRGLLEEGAESTELANAYVYLGVVYAGLGQEGLAKSKFRLAIQQEPGLRLTPDRFSAKVIRVFDAAREAETAAVALQDEVKKGRGKGGWILLGLGGAAAAGVAITVAVRERENAPPTATMTMTPEGQAIAGVTRLTFAGSASDPDGDVLSYQWSFGDGATASGDTVEHVFQREGQFEVALTVGDGLTTTTVQETVTARTLNGRWNAPSPGFLGETEFLVAHGGGSDFELTVLFPAGLPSRTSSGNVSHPRDIALSYDREPCCSVFWGGADGALQTINGTLRCSVCFGLSGCVCNGERPFTLTRQ